MHLLLDFGGGCSAEITKEIDLTIIVPEASYEYEAIGCPDDGTVDLTFTDTTTGLDSNITVSEVLWTVISAGQTFTNTDSIINVNVPKDSLVSFIMVVNFSNGCQDIIEGSFVPGPFATIVFEISPFVICLGDTVYNVTAPNSDFQYIWSPLDGLYFEDMADMSNPGFIGIEDTEYSVTVTDGLCSVEASLQVTVLVKITHIYHW